MYFFYFYPLGLDRPRPGRPWLTRALETLMVLAFLWLHYAPGWGPVRPWSLIFLPGNGAPWTVVTAVFLHAGWLHLLGNLVYFHVFGPPLELRLGAPRFLVYLLLMGAAGNTVHGLVSAFGWMGQRGMGVLGASGAIAGLLAFSLVRFHDAHVRVGWWVFAPLGGHNRAGRSDVPVIAAVAAWLALQVVEALVA
ncbi:MAG TPA: rhomboid family intramembrane serine protease, partial [Candidatus Krumholzibacteria bacterium]|nr:rhomboid family intramembrane serine protease [Candidatus Krumholzibacteria bacterium]